MLAPRCQRKAEGLWLSEIVVLKKCVNKEELDRWEKYFIKSRDTMSPNGYNLTEGGEGLVGLIFTAEHCANIAAARLGKPLSAEHKAKIGAKVRGENNGFFGKQHTDAARIQMSMIHLGETPYKNLIAELRANNILCSKLAEFMKIACSTLSTKIHGQRKFTERDKIKLEKFFGLSADYLLQRDDGKISISNRAVSSFKSLLSELESREISYTMLAKLLSLSLSSVSMKMSGKQNFTERDKKRLVEIFNKPIEYLLQHEE